eukprot:g5616.t1
MSINFILHGECNVGKTSLRNRWVDGIFTGDVAPTFGVDFNIKTLHLVQEVEDEGNEDEGVGEPSAAEEAQPGTGRAGGGRSTKPAGADLQVKINVYDTSGKPGYREVNSTYLLAFDAVLFVYDISSISSLNELRRYFNDPEHRDKLAAKRKAGMAMLLVGNKSDVPLSQRQVGSQTGQDTAAELGIPFVEVSAKTGTNVREAFMFVTTRAVAERLARDQLSRPANLAANKSLARTMGRVPGLQSALRARASMLDVFKSMAGRRRKYVPKERIREEEGVDNERGDNLQLPRLPTKRACSDQPNGGTTLDSQKRHLFGVDSPGAAALAANSPEAQNGAGFSPTSTLLDRPESSPARGGMFERLTATFVDGYPRRPRLGPSGGSPDDRALPPAAAAGIDKACPKSPRRERRGGGGEGRSRSGSPRHANAHSSPASPSHPRSRAASSNSPRSPTAFSPRHKLDPELVGGGSPYARLATTKRRGQVTQARGVSAADQEFLLERSRRGRASPERTAGGVEESATRQLKESSGFWLDKWGIKAAKTDATRERHRILKASPSPPASPKGGLSTIQI